MPSITNWLTRAVYDILKRLTGIDDELHLRSLAWCLPPRNSAEIRQIQSCPLPPYNLAINRTGAANKTDYCYTGDVF